eukprot:8971030-Ditylum_brightwellii.AAC.1
MLLSAAYEQKLITLGSFVPQGLFWMDGEGAYKFQLRSRNKYITKTMSVAIAGLYQDAMKSTIIINRQHMTLEQYLNKEIAEIKSVKETTKTEEDGHWLLVCKKADTPRVFWFVDSMLPVIFNKHIVNADKMIGYDHPWYHHNIRNKTIGSYAASLQRQYEPNWTYLKSAYNKIFDTLSLKCPNKRIMVNTTKYKKDREDKPNGQHTTEQLSAYPSW